MMMLRLNFFSLQILAQIRNINFSVNFHQIKKRLNFGMQLKVLPNSKLMVFFIGLLRIWFETNVKQIWYIKHNRVGSLKQPHLVNVFSHILIIILSWYNFVSLFTLWSGNLRPTIYLQYFYCYCVLNKTSV